MKKAILFLFSIVFSISVMAQNYADSLISTQLTQRAAVYIGYYIKRLPSDDVWNNATAPATLKNYVQKAGKLDSLFTVTLKASYITGLIDLLLASSNEVTQVDRLSIINNSPSIVGYTALANQIVTLSNGNGPYKHVATFIKNYYTDKLAEFANIRQSQINSVVTWVNN